MNEPYGFIDVHAHLDMLEDNPEETLRRAKANGVEKIVTIGTEMSDFNFVLDVSKRLYPDVYCTLGVHPHHGVSWSKEVGDFIRLHAAEKQVIAVGEIGLDYYYNQSPIQEQKQAFVTQLDLAVELGLPVEIHTRDAEKDTAEILQNYKGKIKGMVHCFTSSEWLARQTLDIGLNISFSGVVTFKNADSLREVVKFVPLDRLHVETDAPFLAPVPQRGKKNTPAFVVHTAEKVAELKGVSLDQLANVTKKNAQTLFPKIIW